MSYARFGDASGVYVFLSVAGYLECCGCSLHPASEEFASTDAMVAHLRDHIAAGHVVPADLIPSLENDRESNEAYLEGHRDAREMRAVLGCPCGEAG